MGLTIQRNEFFASLWFVGDSKVLCIKASALTAHTRVRVSVCLLVVLIFGWLPHHALAATPLSLPGAGTVYSDILSLIVIRLYG
jgi:hypothetical protein